MEDGFILSESEEISLHFLKQEKVNIFYVFNINCKVFRKLKIETQLSFKKKIYIYI